MQILEEAERIPGTEKRVELSALVCGLRQPGEGGDRRRGPITGRRRRGPTRDAGTRGPDRGSPDAGCRATRRDRRAMAHERAIDMIEIRLFFGRKRETVCTRH